MPEMFPNKQVLMISEVEWQLHGRDWPKVPNIDSIRFGLGLKTWTRLCNFWIKLRKTWSSSKFKITLRRIKFSFILPSISKLEAKHRRFLLDGTMERHGTERNGMRSGTVQVQNKRNGQRTGTVQAQNELNGPHTNGSWPVFTVPWPFLFKNSVPLPILSKETVTIGNEQYRSGLNAGPRTVCLPVLLLKGAVFKQDCTVPISFLQRAVTVVA